MKAKCLRDWKTKERIELGDEKYTRNLITGKMQSHSSVKKAARISAKQLMKAKKIKKIFISKKSYNAVKKFCKDSIAGKHNTIIADDVLKEIIRKSRPKKRIQ
jgi:hypothetical protein